MISKFKLFQTASILAMVFTYSVSLSQTGAGGVGTSANNIIWLDANELTMSSGDLVTNFTDLSGNSNTFNQTSSSKKPVYTTNAINGLPALTYDGVNDLLSSGAIPSLNSSNITYYVVFKRATMTNQILITAAYASSPTKWRTYCNNTSNLLISAQYSPSINHVSYTDPGAPTFISTHITPSAITLYKQGVLQMNKVASYTTPAGHQTIGLGNTTALSSPNNYTMNGLIAEVIIYNSALNTLQRLIIENYLGAKYGMAVPNDLYAYQASHNIGLVALGNNGINTQTTAKGSGIMELSGALSLDANDYLMAAHSNQALSLFTTVGLPPSLAGYSRWKRTWRVDETGTVGATNVKFYLAGGNNFGSSTTYTLLVDTDGNYTDATQYTGVYDAGSETITFNVDFNDGDHFTLAGLIQILDIHSITDGNWSNPATWDCTCVPSMSDNVFIDPSHDVTVDVNANCRNLTIESTSSLIMNSAVNLDIYEDWDIFGTTNFTNGSVSMVGFINQTIDGHSNTVTFNDLNMDKVGTLTLNSGSYVLNGTLSPTAGDLVLTNAVGNTFTVNSTSGGTEGRIGETISPASISGNFTVKRFIPAGLADYRDICSPVIGATFVDWDPDLLMSGPGFPDGCAWDSTDCYNSVRLMKNGIQYEVIDVTQPIMNGTGYYVFMGDDLNTFSGTTLSSTGQLNGTVDIPINLNTGWQTIGNPYASPILYSLTQRTSQISNYFYIWDSSIGDYQWYDGSTGLGSVSELDAGRISTSQSIWIYVTSLGTITFQQNDKTTTGTYFKSSAPIDNSLYVKIKEDASTYTCTINFSEDAFATDNLDSLLDMRHLSHGFESGPKLAIETNEGVLLKKNFIQADFRNKSFELFTKIQNPGYHTIELSNLENFTDYRKIVLFDAQTNEFIDLTKENSYTFYSDAFEGNRFTLIFTNEELVEESSILSLTNNDATSEDIMTITQMGHTFNIELSEVLAEEATISLVNMLGQSEVYQTQVNFVQGSNIISLPAELSGVHVLVIRSGKTTITKKVVL